MAGIAIVEVFASSYIGTCGSVNLKNSIILKNFCECHVHKICPAKMTKTSRRTERLLRIKCGNVYF